MIVWLIKRLLLLPLTLFVLVSISFFMMRLTPGGPFSSERNLDPVIEQALMEKYHLNESLLQQYFRFLGDLLQGDLGPSFIQKSKTVNEIIAATLPTSILLGLLAMIIALSLGLSMGITAALYRSRGIDYLTMFFAVLGMSVPAFVIGPLLQLTFAKILHWFPTAGYHGFTSPSFLVLPALTLGLPFAARIARLSRGGMLEVIHQNYIKTAKARGLSERRVILHHALKGALVPVASYLGPAIAAVTTGSLVVEKIFQIPGLGREFVESALNRDYTLAMGTVLIYGTLLILMNLLSDLISAWMDPRLRREI